MGPDRNVPGAGSWRVRLGGGRHHVSIENTLQLVTHRSLGGRFIFHNSSSTHHLWTGAQQSRRATSSSATRASTRSECGSQLALSAGRPHGLRLRSKIIYPLRKFFFLGLIVAKSAFDSSVRFICYLYKKYTCIWIANIEFSAFLVFLFILFVSSCLVIDFFSSMNINAVISFLSNKLSTEKIFFVSRFSISNSV